MHITADLPQTQRQSVTEAISGFKVRVIVSTDVMDDVDLHRVNLVVNLDLPATAAAYVRRTGRCGSRGIAVAFVTQEELARLQQYLQKVPGGKVLPSDQHIEEVNGYCKWWFLHRLEHCWH